MIFFNTSEQIQEHSQRQARVKQSAKNEMAKFNQSLQKKYMVCSKIAEKTSETRPLIRLNFSQDIYLMVLGILRRHQNTNLENMAPTKLF